MNGIDGLHCQSESAVAMAPEASSAVALASYGATISRNNTPHASRQIGAPWGVIFSGHPQWLREPPDSQRLSSMGVPREVQ